MLRYLFLCSVLAYTSASAEPVALTLDDVAALTRVTRLVVSPSGKHVAFIREIPRDPFSEEDGEAWAELHLLSSGDDQPRRFLRGQVNVSGVQWSPDEKQTEGHRFGCSSGR